MDLRRCWTRFGLFEYASVNLYKVLEEAQITLETCLVVLSVANGEKVLST